MEHWTANFSLPPEPIAAGLLVVALLGLLWRRGRLVGTTLVAPSRWAAFSLTLLLMAELAAWQYRGAAWCEAVRYAAASATLCATVALLGAKRPQNAAWQFIVLAFWVVLLMPGGEMLLFRAGEPLRLSPAWSWLSAILVALGGLNYLPTRHALAGVLVSLGQGALLWPFSHFVTSAGDSPLSPWFVVIGPACFALASWLTVLNVSRRPNAGALDRAWLDFRDSFGAVWGLRVQQRLQAVSDAHRWQTVVTWYGFEYRGQPPLPQHLRRLQEKTLRSLLRRFVSREWIDARLVE